jgi:putative acetyltransferase
MHVQIRPETPTDYPGIREVNDGAFGQTNEGLLIEKLRLNPDFIPGLSLVAELEGKVIGHILFFPIEINQDANSFPSLALAPMAVRPEYQNKGIGGQLIQKGLEKATALGFDSVIVLGHQHYYPRFGFVPAARWKIKSPFDVPEEVFMAMALVPDGLKNVSGTVKYPKEFEEVG